MLAFLIDLGGSYLLTRQFANWAIVIPLAVVLGILSSIVGTVLLDVVLYGMFPATGSAQRMVSGFILHPLVCLVAVFWFGRLHKADSVVVTEKQQVGETTVSGP